ncbi:hypothetical protein ACH79_42080 [Bradyrhizobium sp. CCBAU 051011]|uniref:hypothetical protein n=1 Tax=Bradyrhizobium sp. CCBAU 051011 TaxID=858422 RepID=UPI001373C87A|nr:hypothetical protein [Bradyrhizobium sp. CCBAU 051011]QHO78197.1 hypothetical protein ACH79_42080 [Bradyrhizobium sp. CCBAU 051011]
MGKKAAKHYTPEERAAISRRLTAEEIAVLKEERAKQEKGAKIIDRAIGVEAGLIPPPWAEKLLATTEAKTRKEGPKERRVNLISRGYWPPEGKPPAKLSNADIVKKVGDAYHKRYGHAVDRTTILRSRTIGRLPRP